MEREQTKEIVKRIKSIYQNKFAIDNPKELVDTWHDILKDYEFNDVMANLTEYVKGNKFAPSVAELIDYKPKHYPGHTQARGLIEQVERFKNERSGPPKNVNIRDILRG